MKRIILLTLAVFSQFALAETVQVKYLGSVSLDSFACKDVREGSDVSRICYDKTERYMVIKLKATYYHYCEVDGSTMQAFLGANTKREFFEARIRGTGSDGPFDCRTHPIPKKYRG